MPVTSVPLFPGAAASREATQALVPGVWQGGCVSCAMGYGRLDSGRPSWKPSIEAGVRPGCPAPCSNTRVLARWRRAPSRCRRWSIPAARLTLRRSRPGHCHLLTRMVGVGQRDEHLVTATSGAAARPGPASSGTAVLPDNALRHRARQSSPTPAELAEGRNRPPVKACVMPPCPASERRWTRTSARLETIKMVVVLFGIPTFSWLTPRATRPLPSYAAP